MTTLEALLQEWMTELTATPDATQRTALVAMGLLVHATATDVTEESLDVAQAHQRLFRYLDDLSFFLTQASEAVEVDLQALEHIPTDEDLCEILGST